MPPGTASPPTPVPRVAYRHSPKGEEKKETAGFAEISAASVGILPSFLARSIPPLGSLADTTQGPMVSFGIPLITSEIGGRISNYNRPAIASSIMLSTIHSDTKLALTPRNNDSGSRVRSWHSTLVTDRSTFQFCPGKPSESCAGTNPLLHCVRQIAWVTHHFKSIQWKNVPKIEHPNYRNPEYRKPCSATQLCLFTL
ncbi:uncharacterized protein BDZ83DRAFT_248445 [Colletotrichum acutatum]|uniref:Uncharacterized protein n=1 Tax=Glomerella acutata TaxID=27357 RepID=A0AAD8XQ62_GLOAC|nr:uncharacterized protein BDZ83DRAFT_248445 [Colletotrichum acutatum]KAK1731397.1 hypothetical protein BDZ83DRAFT_248445 [Colletotrichum acutatum]